MPPQLIYEVNCTNLSAKNDNHQVTAISTARLQVITYADAVIGDLESDMRKNFLDGNDNGPNLYGQFNFLLMMNQILEE
jgi:hypothetical protein